MASHQEPQTYITRANERREQDVLNAEKGMAAKVSPVVTTEEAEDERETRHAKHINWGDAVIDVCIAVLPLYFVGFCIAAKLRDGTLMNSFTNQAILQMAKFNPTIFPIVFTLIFAKFIKAAANWKLERGATVGSIQHLLGSRTLVSSLFTPMRLRTWSFVVPLLIIMWACNPLGGQLSLRSVSQATNITTISTSFVYIDPTSAVDLRSLGTPSSNYNKVVDTTFSTALLTPPSSKNGTQDVFGNIQIPMLEYLRLNQTADADGWFYTVDNDLTGIYAVVANAMNLTEATARAADALNLTEAPARAKPIYASLVGIPYIADLANISAMTATGVTQSGSDSKLQKIENDLFGNSVVNTQVEFTFKTSYVYSDCSLPPLHVGPEIPYDSTNGLTVGNISQTTFGNATDVATNGAGFSIDHDSSHNLNSTSPRNIIVESWLAVNDYDLDISNSSGQSYSTISEAQCELTTTYVEAQVYCATSNNCTVSKIRQSKASHQPSYLTFLDGISYPKSYYTGDQSTPDDVQQYHDFASVVGARFFKALVNSTGIPDVISNLSPIESFFASPDSPFKAAYSGQGAGSGESAQPPIVEVGPLLFSQRLTQLLNTYWLSSIEPFQLLSGIDLDMIANGETTPLPSSRGSTFVERIVLRCHIPYMAILLVISIALFGMGLMTAYLDATRKGPDVLDDFVNSLRHNPYVHTDKLGPSMEDGKEMVQRLKHTVVKMGDVQPGDSVGYVAIGTPNEDQPVVHLDHRRKYV